MVSKFKRLGVARASSPCGRLRRERVAVPFYLDEFMHGLEGRATCRALLVNALGNADAPQATVGHEDRLGVGIDEDDIDAVTVPVVIHVAASGLRPPSGHFDETADRVV